MNSLATLLFENPLAFFVLAPLLLYSVIAHEVAHGLVAYGFGDDTAMRAGRLTLNPLSHVDPLGMLMLFLVGFGWARPVPVDYNRLKRWRFATLFVALAGCVMNILMASIALYLIRLESVRGHEVFLALLALFARINIILGAFNLIPIPPLDGSKILTAFLSEKQKRVFDQSEFYGILLLIILLYSGLLDPVITAFQQWIYALISAAF